MNYAKCVVCGKEFTPDSEREWRKRKELCPECYQRIVGIADRRPVYCRKLVRGAKRAQKRGWIC